MRWVPILVCGVIGAIARMEFDERVVVHEIEQTARAAHKAGHRTSSVDIRQAIGDNARFDQIDYTV